MSSHAALAAATSLAIALNYNIGAEFTVTVTGTAGGEAAVDDVPFVTKGKEKYQMNQFFWKVSPP